MSDVTRILSGVQDGNTIIRACRFVCSQSV